MIIQGTNNPLIFTFPEEMKSIKDIEICLYSENIELKHWTLTDIVFKDEYTIEAPLTQEESVLFPVGKCTIEIKYMDKTGYTVFAKTINNAIVHRFDHTIMEGANTNGTD